MLADALTVFIVDDDVSILRSVSRVLRLADYSVEAFGSPLDFLERLPHDGAGCVIIDLQMPEMSGLELQEAARSKGSTLPVIFLSGQGNIETAVKAVKAGAVDFLEKPVASESLLASVRAAVDAHRTALADGQSKAFCQDRFKRLTPREREVCLRVGRGLLNKQIAFELGASEKTIKLHRARVMRKLSIGSVAEMVDLLRTIGTR